MSLVADRTRGEAPGGRPRRGRAPGRGALLIPAGLSLLLGLDAALLLLGLPAPLTAERLPDVHGMLLVYGFLGTLISLERAVASGRRLGFAAPTLLGIGALLLVSPAPPAVGRAALVAGTVALTLTYVPLWRRQRDDAVLVQALGAVAALGGAVLWLGDVPVRALLPWLVGFVVLTIAGERLELARIALDTRAAGRAGATLVGLASVVAGAVVATLVWPFAGYLLLGAALLVLVGWLARHDIAGRTVRSTGLPRFSGGCLLAGYAWLAVAAGLWLVGGPATEGAAFDAVTHAVFLGFAMSMVLAHAPIILPAVLRRPLPYHPALLVPAALLQLSLVLRLYGGDALGSEVAWRLGGAGNIVALLLFVAVAAWSSLRAPHRKALP